MMLNCSSGGMVLRVDGLFETPSPCNGRNVTSSAASSMVAIVRRGWLLCMQVGCGARNMCFRGNERMSVRNRSGSNVWQL